MTKSLVLYHVIHNGRVIPTACPEGAHRTALRIAEDTLETVEVRPVPVTGPQPEPKDR